MPIALADILDERQIKLQLRSRTKANALREIIDLFANTNAIEEREQFFQQVIAREEEHSTLSSDTIAFPHARTELVEQLVLAVGRSRAGIPWNAENERARLIFVVAVPQQLINDYLVVVGALARAITDEARREILFNATRPAEFIEALRTAPSL